MTQPNELAAFDALLKPPGPPELIHGWQHTQMSIASYYGGLTYQVAAYTIAFNEPGQPLVRLDVFECEFKAAMAVAKAQRMEEAQRAAQA